jgi:hypothetical protein
MLEETGAAIYNQKTKFRAIRMSPSEWTCYAREVTVTPVADYFGPVNNMMHHVAHHLPIAT